MSLQLIMYKRNLDSRPVCGQDLSFFVFIERNLMNMKMTREYYNELLLSDDFARATATFFGINGWGDQTFIYYEPLDCYINCGDKVFTDDTKTTQLRLALYLEDVPDTENDLICKMKTCTITDDNIKVIDDNYATFRYENGEWL